MSVPMLLLCGLRTALGDRATARLERLAAWFDARSATAISWTVLSADLTQRAEIERVARRIRQDEAPVTVLVVLVVVWPRRCRAQWCSSRWMSTPGFLPVMVMMWCWGYPMAPR